MPYSEFSRDPVVVLLRRIAAHALGGSLLTGAALAGCGEAASATKPTGQTRPQGALDPCTAPGLPVRAAELRLAVAADYVAVRQANGMGRGGGSFDAGVADNWVETSFSVQSETGTACATASDLECAATVARHPEQRYPSFCPQACVEWSVVSTRGDDVKRSASPAQLVELFGGIDSQDEAFMLAASNKYDVTCPDSASPGFYGSAQPRYVRTVPEGYELSATRYEETCPVTIREYRLLVTTAGEVRELDSKLLMDDKEGGACIGRIPAGLLSHSERRGFDALGDHLAHCAHLEAASVYAFERLARELQAHGAPAPLIERALAAAADEVRHAQVVGAMAKARGAALIAPAVEALPVRTLHEVALENAVEGCVRETYGALVGAYQAARAQDEDLRRAMHAIAIDEAHHAALSYDVHTWASRRLDAATRAQIDEAQRSQLAKLHEECTREPDPRVAFEAGLPSAAAAIRMLEELASQLIAPRFAVQA
jgi:hypothetical protein